MRKKLVWSVLVASCFLESGCENNKSGEKVPDSRVSPLTPRPPPTESPTQEVAGTQEVDPQTLVRPTARYRTFHLPKGEALPIRESAAAQAQVLGDLEGGTQDVRLTGDWRREANKLWVQLAGPDQGGWVDRAQLIEHPPGNACSDAEIGPVFEDFVEAIQNEDGRGLARIVSPSRGFLFRSHAANETIVIQGKQLENLFDESVRRDWRMYPDSARAPFRRAVLPSLKETYASGYLLKCNDAAVAVPHEFQGLTLVSSRLKLAASNWVLGLEYVDGDAYVALLFHAE